MAVGAVWTESEPYGSNNDSVGIAIKPITVHLISNSSSRRIANTDAVDKWLYLITVHKPTEQVLLPCLHHISHHGDGNRGNSHTTNLSSSQGELGREHGRLRHSEDSSRVGPSCYSGALYLEGERKSYYIGNHAPISGCTKWLAQHGTSEPERAQRKGHLKLITSAEYNAQSMA